MITVGLRVELEVVISTWEAKSREPKPNPGVSAVEEDGCLEKGPDGGSEK